MDVQESIRDSILGSTSPTDPSNEERTEGFVDNMTDNIDKGDERIGQEMPPPPQSSYPKRILSRTAVVTVRDAVKRYGTAQPILNGFNMTVQKGTIYSLLGSSGCGKTTLLSCVVGTKDLNSGRVLVFGAQPGTKESGIPGSRIGYMPQDTALYNQFSISESIRYFGTLYGMPDSAINASRDFLMEFLDLPQGSRKIGNLSGGQKRRVSLALSLVHSPELLILDEPTVGVDPLLRESIWNHLCKLVSTNKTTVIITTHYIEEARQSDMVGLMRGGRLLAEKSPAALLKEHQTNLLEDIVLKLCKKDGFGNGGGDSTITYQEARGSDPVGLGRNSVANFKDKVLEKRKQSMIEDPLSFRNSSSLNRICALVMKNLLMMIRNYLFLLFMLIMPACTLIMFSMALGSDPKPLDFGFLNLEKNVSESCASIAVMPFPERCNVQNLPCSFMSKLPSDIVYLKKFETEEAATVAVLEGDIRGFMSFPDKYSDNLYFRLTSPNTLDNLTFKGSEISFRMDSSNTHIALMLKRLIFEAYKEFVQAVLVDCDINPRLGDLPLKYESPIYGADDTDFQEYMLPGILIAIMCFFPLFSSGVSYVTEQKEGTLERSIVAGVQSWEIITAFFITESSVVFIQSGLAFVIILVVFGIEIQGSLALAMTVSVLSGLSGISMGFTLASFCKEEVEVALFAFGAFFSIYALAGLIWPLEGLPIVIQYFCRLLPCTMPGEALRSIISRGWGLGHLNVSLGLVSSLAWISIFWILTTLNLRLSSRTK